MMGNEMTPRFIHITKRFIQVGALLRNDFMVSTGEAAVYSWKLETEPTSSKAVVVPYRGKRYVYVVLPVGTRSTGSTMTSYCRKLAALSQRESIEIDIGSPGWAGIYVHQCDEPVPEFDPLTGRLGDADAQSLGCYLSVIDTRGG